ncbi:hypothetical protein QUB56_31870 [Microcoleus sp. AR_TQ3_B6]
MLEGGGRSAGRSCDRLDPLPAPEYPFSSHLFDATDGSRSTVDRTQRKTSQRTLLSVALSPI